MFLVIFVRETISLRYISQKRRKDDLNLHFITTFKHEYNISKLFYYKFFSSNSILKYTFIKFVVYGKHVSLVVLDVTSHLIMLKMDSKALFTVVDTWSSYQSSYWHSHFGSLECWNTLLMPRMKTKVPVRVTAWKPPSSTWSTSSSSPSSLSTSLWLWSSSRSRSREIKPWQSASWKRTR